jgi:hypothetical protein
LEHPPGCPAWKMSSKIFLKNQIKIQPLYLLFKQLLLAVCFVALFDSPLFTTKNTKIDIYFRAKRLLNTQIQNPIAITDKRNIAAKVAIQIISTNP